MRRWLLHRALLSFIILCMVCTPLFSQGQRKLLPKSDRLFYSIAYYDLFDNNISGSLLDRLTVATQGFGDKGLVRDMVLRQMIFSHNEVALLDSLDAFRDDIRLAELPPISDEVMERPLRFFLFYLINELLLFESDNLIENYNLLINRMNENLFLESDGDSGGNVLEVEEGAYTCLRFYLNGINAVVSNHPGLDFSISYAKEQLLYFQESHPGASYMDMYLSKFQEARVKYPIIQFYLPVPLSDCMAEFVRHNSVIPLKQDVIRDPGGFIEATFLKLYKRAPSTEEMQTLLPLYEGDDPFDPRLLYYVLMSADEYLYY